jgi:CTP synthase
LDNLILKKFKINAKSEENNQWSDLIERIDNTRETLNIAILGKYFKTGNFVLSDVYVSVIEAIKHGCWACGYHPNLTWLDSNDFQDNPDKLSELDNFAGVVTPGGFGVRGVEEIINCIQYIRENKIPYLGLCYGMHLGVVEFARNVCLLESANTTEIDNETPQPVIHIMPEQIKKIQGQGYGATMRLGGYKCDLKAGSLVKEIYGVDEIVERHRHRYEFNNKYRQLLENKGMVLSGLSPDGTLVEIVELDRTLHPFFVGVQFHPEFQSSPIKPHPLFKSLACACKRRTEEGETKWKIK